MSYTVLRVVDEGVLFFEGHAQRFACARDAFLTFAAQAKAGIYALIWRDGALEVQERRTTSLFEGIPVRYLTSPIAEARVVKTPPPNPYQPIRQPGIATLLTSADGSEIYESCTAAAVEWDGSGFVAPPLDRPCLDSTALRAFDAAQAVHRAPLRTDSTAPLALINAVSGLVIPLVAGRAPLPEEARARAAQIIRETIRRR